MGSEEPEDDLAGKTVLDPLPGAGEDDAPQWPDEAAEVVFLSEQGRSSGAALVVEPATPNSGATAEPAEETNAPLPPLQTLIDRIPADARDVLEDLFRARFVSVKRVQSSTLK